MKTTNSRRDFIKKSATLAIGALATKSLLSNPLSAIPTDFIEEQPNLLMANNFTLAPLPYAYDALEPFIDKETMEIHYTKHHQGYVTNLNKAIEGVDKTILGANPTLESLFEKMPQLPMAVRNNAGGHYNHTLFWTLMTPAKMQTAPSGKLLEALTSTFGSVDEFKKQFNEGASKRFGSGWAWLVVSKDKLAITSTPNQDNPLMNLDSIEKKGFPLLGIDVWEHAYYLKYQNKRADYASAWWNVVNWQTVEKRFAGAV
ncbi:MAG: superoxide dismutase [Bacteroidia bacterium]